MAFTLKDIEKLQKLGKIRGFQQHEAKKQKPEIGGRKVAKHYHKQDEKKDWIAMNLLKWCNDRALQLEEEHRFHMERKWRFDWCIPALKLAIEFEGGIFNPNGDHRSIKGMSRDIEKYNMAQGMGYRIIRLTALNYTELFNELAHYDKVDRVHRD